ncbi:MAG TPA: hypothetical protein VFQ23_21260, partial [Anaerolineales bacterium]|nr:hypothetical protein [Anaerolineales bacterium]
GGLMLQPNAGDVYELLSLKTTNVILELGDSTIHTLQDVPACDAVVCFAPNHFLHNIITSILILPTSPQMDGLRQTVREVYLYWRPDWDGSFNISALSFFVLNLFFIVLGISVAWGKLKMPGLTPLAIFIFYDLSTGLARTSGGRYLVPMDWIISIYFLLGVFQSIVWFANQIGVTWNLFSSPVSQNNSQNTSNPKLSSVILIVAALFGLGSLIPLSESFQAARYQNTDVAQSLIEHEPTITSAGMSISDIDAFLMNPNAELLIGRILYPRFYPIDRGEIFIQPYVTMGFPRTAFIFIGPHGEQGVVLPGDTPKYFPHAADALVLGCREEKYLDAVAVIFLDDSQAMYTRSPKSELTCPLQQPVCNSNRVCQ